MLLVLWSFFGWLFLLLLPVYVDIESAVVDVGLVTVMEMCLCIWDKHDINYEEISNQLH